ncbi:unnamed protein product [Mytilus edulis]|uniref:Uncharacterized protein n=1 Tax=Mytilus edulis TaxID=6550 RepID=A0A8S3Q2S0_MYTED|nr:unnamed protein product [Mytilus edulis]
MLQSIIPFLCIVSGALAVDGNWSAWGSWGGCSQTCGSGTRYRSRSCSNPFPSFNGADCVGDTQVSQTCNTNTCPAVDGAWSDWGDWGDCSNACGSGTKTRTRDCTDPTPCMGDQIVQSLTQSHKVKFVQVRVQISSNRISLKSLEGITRKQYHQIRVSQIGVSPDRVSPEKGIIR